MSPSPLSQSDYLAREQEIMDATLELLDTMDVSQLTMDKVVKHVPYSKGTVYNHFSSKEDLLSGISNFALRRMIGLFSRIEPDMGCSRERLVLFCFAYLIYAIQNPVLFRTALCAKSPSVLGKTSADRQEEHEQLEAKLMSVWLGSVDDGISENNFSLPDNMSKHQVCFSLWSTSYGTIMLLNEEIEQCTGRRGMILEREFFNSLSLMLDGLNWHPLSSQQDYLRQLSNNLNHYFGEELEQIKQRGRPLLI